MEEGERLGQPTGPRDSNTSYPKTIRKRIEAYAPKLLPQEVSLVMEYFFGDVNYRRGPKDIYLKPNLADINRNLLGNLDDEETMKRKRNAIKQVMASLKIPGGNTRRLINAKDAGDIANIMNGTT